MEKDKLMEGLKKQIIEQFNLKKLKPEDITSSIIQKYLCKCKKNVVCIFIFLV